MADKTIIIPEPNATDRQPVIVLDSGRITVTYTRGGHSYQAELKAADLAPPFEADLNAIIGKIIPFCKPKLRRSDGGDNSGF